MTHDFGERLTYSHAQADQPWWEVVYRQAFPGFKCMVDMREDCAAQRAGIDRYIHLLGGKILAVDEKVRERDYGDILLEIWSNRERQHPGWLLKPLLCDYIAYAFVPSARCYLLPVPQLQRAWNTHGARWRAEHPPVLAANQGYTTESVPVPIRELLDSIRDALVIHWSSR